MTAVSIRERAVMAEQRRVANANLSLVPHDTEHAINVMVESGSSLDDHRTESGYCETCKLWINRTYNLTNGEVEDSVMSVDQRSVLQRGCCSSCWDLEGECVCDEGEARREAAREISQLESGTHHSLNGGR